MTTSARRAGTKVRKQQQRPVYLRQGTITDFNTVTHVMRVEIDGEFFPDIKYMDHISPVVNRAVWIADLGGGRFVAIGTTQ